MSIDFILRIAIWLAVLVSTVFVGQQRVNRTGSERRSAIWGFTCVVTAIQACTLSLVLRVSMPNAIAWCALEIVISQAVLAWLARRA